MQNNNDYIDYLSTLSRNEVEHECINLKEMNQIYRRQIRFFNFFIIAVLVAIIATLQNKKAYDRIENAKWRFILWMKKK